MASRDWLGFDVSGAPSWSSGISRKLTQRITDGLEYP
jgi:hypothetical protein